MSDAASLGKTLPACAKRQGCPNQDAPRPLRPRPPLQPDARARHHVDPAVRVGAVSDGPALLVLEGVDDPDVAVARLHGEPLLVAAAELEPAALLDVPAEAGGEARLV